MAPDGLHDRLPQHRPGDIVVWRCIQGSRHDSPKHITYAMPAILLSDASDSTAIHHLPGSIPRQRSGSRVQGPHGSRMLPSGWDGSYEDAPAFLGENVRVYLKNRQYSILRNWNPVRRQFRGWYVNLELPWKSSHCGYDSADLILDVAVSDDLKSWNLKDETEFRWAGEVGILDSSTMKFAERQSRWAIDDIAHLRWPFSADWSRWAPRSKSFVPRLPTGWDQLDD